ncbi:MAG: phytanoyl-CoA dioxygenase family protein [Armatimonadetes bacterium]|nr:phytanoyl-CoA dioxygenase family protein [Armatimonadota bacterium]
MNYDLEQVFCEFSQKGYVLVPDVFGQDEVLAFAEHFEAMLSRGGDGWAEGGVDPESSDPLRRYPRFLQPHRGDAKSLQFMIDPRLRKLMTACLGKTPLAVQTMYYFKPPGARGQALHQDQSYLRAEPGTCIAAWLAVDDCDDENGCLQVVPGTQGLPVLCPVKADMDKSFSGDMTPLPPGLEPINIHMRAGDVLFFNGSLVHGSGPNRSATRFRRSLIGHYIEAQAEQVAQYYFPVYTFDGEVVERQPYVADGGGPCGTMQVVDGEMQITMDGTLAAARAAH